MLSKNPANRPQTMQDVYKSLRGIKVFNRAPTPPAAVEKSK
jgi:hypothetical protein